MSWAEVKKINSNLNITIDELIVEQLLNTDAKVFTSNGTYTVPNGVRKIFVTMVDGGGGGGTSSYDSTWGVSSTRGGKGGGAYGGEPGVLNDRVGGSGGGGGGCIVNEPLLVTPGDVYNIIVGTGGSATQAGGDSKITKNNVDVLVTNLPGGVGGASGGAGGAGGAYGAGGGGGGRASDGDVYANGGKGGLIGGAGGAGGKLGAYGTGGGVYGAGGGGGGRADNKSGSYTTTGGKGAPGIVIICYSPYTFLNLASSLKGV